MERDILCRLVAKLQAQSEPTCQNSMAGSKQRGQPTVRTQLRGLSSACATRCQGGLKICPQRSVLRSYPLEPSGQGKALKWSRSPALQPGLRWRAGPGQWAPLSSECQRGTQQGEFGWGRGLVTCSKGTFGDRDSPSNTILLVEQLCKFSSTKRKIFVRLRQDTDKIIHIGDRRL